METYAICFHRVVLVAVPICRRRVLKLSDHLDQYRLVAVLVQLALVQTDLLSKLLASIKHHHILEIETNNILRSRIEVGQS